MKNVTSSFNGSYLLCFGCFLIQKKCERLFTRGNGGMFGLFVAY